MISLADFLSLGIRQELDRALKAEGIMEPTPIQERAIPEVLAGNDVVAQAQTGTGKTLSFVLPILEKVNPARDEVQALIVTPTRELALQITAEVKKAMTFLDGVNALAVYGGQDVEAQLKKLRRAVHVVVATPGRLLDHLRRGTIDLYGVSTLVLDEADQMLHMGFLPEVEMILDELPLDRQTLLFSATMPDQVRKLANRYLRLPVDLQVEGKRITLEGIKQVAVETTDRSKKDTVMKLVDQHRPYLAILFCRTRRRASSLNEALQANGYLSDELHGDLSQAKREQVMKRFREAKIQLLVATDVAARGLDVEGVTHVFNYDIPQDVDSYIHRIGRTGRAGEEGVAFTIVAPKDRNELAMIEKGIGLKLERQMGEGLRRHHDEPWPPRQPERSDREGRPRDRRGASDERSGRKSDSRAGGRPDSRAGGRPESRAGGRPDSRAGGRPDSRAGGRPDSRAGGRSESRAGGRHDSRAGGRPDSNVGGRPESRAGGRPDSRAGGRPDSRAGGRPDSRAGGRPDSRAGGRPDSRAGGRPDSRAGGRPESRAGGRPDSRPGRGSSDGRNGRRGR
ncbi:DEAD/DEAH box helicase [Tumebacillus lipolyticus]|uniref:RNA helicase n=1 Tax=Tumebacillus lipolyticus TaxID=1280370 RepID=A0ABW4ZXU9_9BACL